MSISTTLTLNNISSSLETSAAKTHQYYQNNNNNNSLFQTYLKSKETSKDLLGKKEEPSDEHSLLLERLSLLNSSPSSLSAGHNTHSTHSSSSLPKSNSYGLLKTKVTIIKQDSLNGLYSTSTVSDDGSEADFVVLSSGSSTSNALTTNTASNTTNNSPNSSLDSEEYEAFLPASINNNNSSNGGYRARPASSSSNSRSHGKSRNSICVRAHAFMTRNWYLSYLVPLSILLALMFVAYLMRDYAKRILFWIETQNPWIIFALFMLFFVIVSFPIVVGYFILMITAGYLFGFLRGFPTVILGANVGIAIAHAIIRSFRHRIPMQKIIKNETGRAILRVISGPRAFKVVLFTRLTPIPFGIQNAIFGVSSINPRVYHTATILGLLPAQIINVYLGSTLRSMQEVLNNHGTAVTGYISFGVEVVCGVALMFWVVQKARKELSDTLLSDIDSDGKPFDIQV